MTVSTILCVDEKGGIGKNNTIPWNIKEDMKRFKSLTINKTIVMGRKTFESIGKVLPYRETIILSSDPKYKVKGATVLNCDLRKAINWARANGAKELMICGGSSIYEYGLEYSDFVYLTEVKGNFDCDTIVNLDSLKNYRLASAVSWRVEGEYEYCFKNYSYE